jgi:hypothetical protein
MELLKRFFPAMILRRERNGRVMGGESTDKRVFPSARMGEDMVVTSGVDF